MVLARRGLSLLVACVLAGGCGGGGAQSFEDVLRGLKNAAGSKATYDAIRHSDDFARQEKAAINAFCSVATQLADNNETVTAEDFFTRVNSEAQAELGEYGAKPVLSAVAKIRATYAFANINPQLAAQYVRACY